MHRTVLIVGAKKEQLNQIKAILGKNFPLRLIDPTQKVKAKEQVELILLPCDFQCSVAHCYASFRFACLQRNFLIKIRLCLGLWRVMSTDRLIKTIALELGYKPLSFSKGFKQLFGVSPRAIRAHFKKPGWEMGGHGSIWRETAKKLI